MSDTEQIVGQPIGQATLADLCSFTPQELNDIRDDVSTIVITDVPEDPSGIQNARRLGLTIEPSWIALAVQFNRRERIEEEITKAQGELNLLLEKAKRITDAIDERERTEQYRVMPYAAYLKTDHWRETSQRHKEIAGYACQTCNASEALGARLHVHHRTYVNLGQERPADLIVLCDACHTAVHESITARTHGRSHIPDDLDDV